ncbi:hypothetical protein SE17_30530, partial [Kouleothrix aurantiaca]
MAEIALIAPSIPRAGRTLKETASICEVCQAQIPASYVADDAGHAHYTRECPTHGRFATDLGPYADFYTRMFELDERIKQR